MDIQKFKLHANVVKEINKLFKSKKIQHPHIVVLSEIIVRKLENTQLPNVKWVQTELDISFTKLKSLLDDLENRGRIIKIYDTNDKRVKFLDITQKGEEFVSRIYNNLHSTNLEKFKIHASAAKEINELYKSKKIQHAHIVVLSEIIARKLENIQLPNVKWVQTELVISFTKLKSLLDDLENRGLIIKINDINDKRVKFLDVTKKGEEFIFQIFNRLPTPKLLEE
jgi:DNA-binding MarR family transcriptional regulator